MSAPGPPDLSAFALFCDVIDSVAWSSGLPPDDAEDFSEAVHRVLRGRDYSLLARLSGRTSLRACLTAVASRMLVEWRNRERHRWYGERLTPHEVPVYRD